MQPVIHFVSQLIGQDFPCPQIIPVAETPRHPEGVIGVDYRTVPDKACYEDFLCFSPCQPEGFMHFLVAVYSRSLQYHYPYHLSGLSHASFKSPILSFTTSFPLFLNTRFSPAVLPTFEKTVPAIDFLNASSFSADTSAMNLDADSLNNSFVSDKLPSCGTLSSSTSAPIPPEKAISAIATPKPPSLQSWQLRTFPC